MQSRIVLFICLGLIFTCHSQQAGNGRGRYWVRDKLDLITERLETVEKTSVKQNDTIKELEKCKNCNADLMFQRLDTLEDTNIKESELIKKFQKYILDTDLTIEAQNDQIIKQEAKMNLMFQRLDKLEDTNIKESELIKKFEKYILDTFLKIEAHNGKMQQLNNQITKQEAEMKLLKQEKLSLSNEVRLIMTIINTLQNEGATTMSEIGKVVKEVKEMNQSINTINKTSVYNLEKVNEKIIPIQKKCDQVQQVEELYETMKNSFDTELEKINNELDRIPTVNTPTMETTTVKTQRVKPKRVRITTTKTPTTTRLPDRCHLTGSELANDLTVGTKVIEKGNLKKRYGLKQINTGSVVGITPGRTGGNWSPEKIIRIRWNDSMTISHVANRGDFNYIKLQGC